MNLGGDQILSRDGAASLFGSVTRRDDENLGFAPKTR
jgi:hypothetical protein